MRPVNDGPADPWNDDASGDDAYQAPLKSKYFTSATRYKKRSAHLPHLEDASAEELEHREPAPPAEEPEASMSKYDFRPSLAAPAAAAEAEEPSPRRRTPRIPTATYEAEPREQSESGDEPDITIDLRRPRRRPTVDPTIGVSLYQRRSAHLPRLSEQEPDDR